jgi:hypothetical protein
MIFLFLTSCKTTQSVADKGETKDLATAKIINNYQKALFQARTLQARIPTHYEDAKTSQNVTLKLRMETDKVIWISATYMGITVAKIMITPDRIQFYEKLKRTYFDGDFTFFEQLFGVSLAFDNIQNILLGQALYGFKDVKYNSQIADNFYHLAPTQTSGGYDFAYLLLPSFYKLHKQSVDMTDTGVFSVKYNDYQKVDGEVLPLQIEIQSTQYSSDQHTQITMDMGQIEINKKLSFPFAIPEGYSPVKF